MEVRIGAADTGKELIIEMPDEAKADDVRAQLDEALASPEGLIWMTDRRGRQVGVPVARVGWVEIRIDDGASKIGFGAA
ncbi:MAG: DUF3107 domain-containing protein [Acidimicrobiales bacterium]